MNATNRQTKTATNFCRNTESERYNYDYFYYVTMHGNKFIIYPEVTVEAEDEKQEEGPTQG